MNTEGQISIQQWESDLAHGLGVDEVLVAPDAGVVVVLPLHINVKVGEVVALWDGELLPHLVTLFLTTLQRHTQFSTFYTIVMFLPMWNTVLYKLIILHI